MSRQLLQTPRFTVEQRSYPGPAGGEIVRDIVVHPGAVVILPILEDGRIVMIRQHRRAVEETLLELAAGTREPGEEPIETARRELLEETGYRAERVEPLMEFYTSPGILTEMMYAFVARELEQVGQRLEDNEEIEVEIHSADALRDMIGRGELRDGKTIATLGAYFARRADYDG